MIMWPVNQALERPFGVSVFGSSVLRTEPDVALIDLLVSRTAPTAKPAFAETRKAVSGVRLSLQRSAIPDSSIEVSRLTLVSVFEGFGAAAKFKGYQSEVGFRIILERLDDLEKVLSDAVEAGANHVRKVKYQTRRLRELREQVRREAVVAARRKAEVYCESAQVRLGNVIHIEDVDPDRLGHRGGHGETVDVSLDDEGEFAALQSGSLEISAAVILGFSILPG